MPAYDNFQVDKVWLNCYYKNDFLVYEKKWCIALMMQYRFARKGAQRNESNQKFQQNHCIDYSGNDSFCYVLFFYLWGRACESSLYGQSLSCLCNDESICQQFQTTWLRRYDYCYNRCHSLSTDTCEERIHVFFQSYYIIFPKSKIK